MTELEAELLGVVKMQREAMDRLFAMLIEATKDNEPHPFFPSQSGQPWAAMMAAFEIIERLEQR